MAEEKKVKETRRLFPLSAQLLAVLLGVLLIVSAVQAFQLLSLDTAVNQQNARVLELQGAAPGASAGAQPGPPGTASSGALPGNLSNLPDMVGGC